MSDAGLNWTAFEKIVKCRAEALFPEAGRLFHGRSGGFPGLENVTVDVFGPVVLIATYGEVAEPTIQTLAAILNRAVGKGMWQGREDFCMVLQARQGPDVCWSALTGTAPQTLWVKYLGLAFEVKIGQTQNVGLFPDMIQGHRLVAELAKGKRILNLFAYTCVFSVVAMNAGADSVVNVDLSKSSLARGRRNHLHNGLVTKDVKFLPHHVMKSLGAFRRWGPFDMVICDPPTYQAGSFKAVRDYPKLARRLGECLNPGADVIACLNAPHLDRAHLNEWFGGGGYRLLATLGRPEAYGENQPDRDLKIHHYRYSPGSGF